MKLATPLTTKSSGVFYDGNGHPVPPDDLVADHARLTADLAAAQGMANHWQQLAHAGNDAIRADLADAVAALRDLVRECTPLGIPSDRTIHGVQMPTKVTLELCRALVARVEQRHA